MDSAGSEQWREDLIRWFSGLSNLQAGVLGGLVGYAAGLLAGPLLRLSLALLILIAFGFLGRSIQNSFESKLGMTGAVAAILALASLGGVQGFLGDAIGKIILYLSPFALALLGAHFALNMHNLHNTEDDPGK